MNKPVPVAEGPPLAGPRQPRPSRILLADDNLALLEVVAELLSESGYEVSQAADGDAAVARLREGAFDLILTDIQMPGATGVDILRAVRERDLDTPVILMTGNPSVESAVSALELGALRYLLKPVSSATLLPAVAQALALTRLTRLRRAALETLGGESRFQADRAGLETVFARATGSLWMAYQPVFYTTDGRAFGHEALLRCSSPEISHAGAFLDVAERLGRTRELGRRVRAAVARDLDGFSGGAMLVNLHPLDLADPLLGSDADPLTRHARRVILEVTERASLESVQGLADTIAQLRGRGFRIAIDDLGAGYAALAAFVSLQPDIVKLDMSLVRDVHLHVTRRKLVASMTHLCRDLGITVVGEGVESVGERDALTELGCDLLQGFLLGRPVPFAGPRVAPGQ